MTYKEILNQIKSSIYNYSYRKGYEPTDIILGIGIYDKLATTNNNIMFKNESISYSSVFGIPITIDYRNKDVIKVGMMEFVTIVE